MIPILLRKGNPFLDAELHYSLFLEHSIQFKGNYFTSRLFLNTAHNAMDNLTFINDTGAFETQVNNLGKYGSVWTAIIGNDKIGHCNL